MRNSHGQVQNKYYYKNTLGNLTFKQIESKN